MNCRPGDLAVIVRPGIYHGWLVSVLYMSQGAHVAPNGERQHWSTAGLWVCESMGGVFESPATTGPIRTRIACIRDDNLRPLRDNDGEDEMLRIAEWRPATLRAWDEFAEGVA